MLFSYCCYNTFWATNTDKALLVVYVLAVGLLITGAYGNISGDLPLNVSRICLGVGGGLFFIAAVASTLRCTCAQNISEDRKKTMITNVRDLVSLRLFARNLIANDQLPAEYQGRVNSASIKSHIDLARGKVMSDMMAVNPKDRADLEKRFYSTLAQSYRLSEDQVKELLDQFK